MVPRILALRLLEPEFLLASVCSRCLRLRLGTVFPDTIKFDAPSIVPIFTVSCKVFRPFGLPTLFKHHMAQLVIQAYNRD